MRRLDVGGAVGCWRRRRGALVACCQAERCEQQWADEYPATFHAAHLNVKGSRSAQHFARIENAVRVQGFLQCPHDVQLHGGSVTLELVHLEAADAVLRTEAAAECPYQLMDGAFDFGLAC